MLEGCGNRVSYLRACTQLARAQVAIASGGNLPGARADLDAVLAQRDDVRANVPDNQPWQELLAEADRVSAKLARLLNLGAVGLILALLRTS